MSKSTTIRDNKENCNMKKENSLRLLKNEKCNLPRMLSLPKAINIIRPHWPILFFRENIRPLASNITEQLLVDAERRCLSLTPGQIRRSIKRLMWTDFYLERVTVGTLCYNSDGTVNSIISHEYEKQARRKLEKIRLLRKNK